MFAPGYVVSRDLIEAAVLEKKSLTFRKGTEWLIGNTEKPAPDHLFFAFGKLTKSISEKYDSDSKNFTEVTEEHAPYTFVAINLMTQVCAIGQKTKISPTIGPVSKRLIDVLNSTETARLNEINFTISEISDPEPFIKAIEEAVLIKKFEMTFSLPNPWDVEKDLHAPQENLLKSLKGKKGKTIIDGENLEKEVLIPTIKSIASTGDTASAILRLPSERNFSKKKMAGSQVSIILFGLFQVTKKAIMEKIFPEMDNQYHTIRGQISREATQDNKQQSPEAE